MPTSSTIADYAPGDLGGFPLMEEPYAKVGGGFHSDSTSEPRGPCKESSRFNIFEPDLI